MRTAQVTVGIVIAVAVALWFSGHERVPGHGGAVEPGAPGTVPSPLDPVHLDPIGLDSVSLEPPRPGTVSRTAMRVTEAPLPADSSDDELETTDGPELIALPVTSGILISGVLELPDDWGIDEPRVGAMALDTYRSVPDRTEWTAEPERSFGVSTHSWQLTVDRPGAYIVYCDTPPCGLRIDVSQPTTGVRLVVAPPARCVVRVRDAVTQKEIPSASLTWSPAYSPVPAAGHGKWNPELRAYEMSCVPSEVRLRCGAWSQCYGNSSRVWRVVPGDNETVVDLVRVGVIDVTLRDSATEEPVSELSGVITWLRVQRVLSDGTLETAFDPARDAWMIRSSRLASVQLHEAGRYRIQADSIAGYWPSDAQFVDVSIGSVTSVDIRVVRRR